MATVSDRTKDSLAVRPWSKKAKEGSKSDQYLAKRFAAASADLKAMALTTFLLAFAVAAVGWFLLGVLVEHWLVPGGLAAWARWTWFMTGGSAALVAAVVWLLPLVRYRVNLVFAARELERGHPDLHNDLVNAVLVKERSGEAAEAIVKSLRRRAARRLSKVADEGVVDRTPAVRLAWILSVLVCLVILYAVLAPKSFVASAARLAAPWSGMVAPSRVQIERPQLAWRVVAEEPGVPGADRSIAVVNGRAELVRGRQVVVSSTITGLKSDERPVLAVTPLRDDGTPDATLTPWQMAMVAGSGGIRTAVLPGPDRGLDYGVEIQVVAGDGRSERIRVAVVDAPTLLVRELRYDYPEYMNRESETLPWQGDIRAVEGTRVTIVAEANRPLAAAAIDLGCDGRRNISLALDKATATSGKVTFPLDLSADRTGPKFSTYRFIYRPRTSDGQPTEPDVIGQLEHRIDVTPDLAPEVVIEAPEEKVLKVPPDAPVTVRVRGVDPDFGLARVHLETRLEGGEIRRGDELLVGQPRLSFRGAATLVPQALGGKPGTKLEYRGVAIDTRPDKPNQTVTEWQVLEIDASAPPQEQEQPPQEDDGEQKGDGGKPQAENQGQGQDPGQGQDQGQQDGQGQQGQGQQGDDRGDAGGDQKGDGNGESQEAKGDGEQGKGNQGQGERSDGEGQQGDGQQGEGEGQQGQGEGNKGQGGQGQQGKGEGEKGDGADGQGKQQGKGDSADGRAENGEKQQSQGQGQEGRGQQGQGADGEGQQAEGQKGQTQEGQQGEGQQGKGQSRQAEGQQDQGQQGTGTDGSEPSQPNPAVASDGTDDGEAIERILENRRQEGGQKGAGESREGAGEGNAAGSEGSEPQQGQSQGEGQEGQSASPQGQPGDGQQGQGQEPGQGQQGDGQPGGGQPDQGQSGQGQAQPAGQGQDGQQGQDGEGQAGQGKKGREQEGEGQAGQGQQPGQGQAGEGQPGQGEGTGDEGGDGKGQQGEGQQGQQGRGKKNGQGDGQQGQGAGEGSQPGGQSEQSGDAPPAGDSEGQGGQGGQGDASDGRGGQGDATPLERREMQWTDQDLDHARNAANLALEHLRDSLAKGRTDVLDDLGWSPEQAKAFLDRWQQMQGLANSGDAKQRAEFEKAVRSLGLRPDGVQSSRAVPTDRKGGQAEGRRSKPPSDYREQFKAFMQGTSVE